MKGKTTIVMAALLAFGSTAPAFGASFTDINNVPWEGAKTYINQVADAGLMVGDEDIKTGKKIFRANDKVTYCETAQLAYTLLKKAGKQKDTTDLLKKWSSVLAGYGIPSWAHESVAYCMQYGILSLNDVSLFMTNNRKTQAYATREGVAVIFGKALSDMDTINTNAKLTFKDSASIASTSVPYVDLLSRMGIMVGDSDNNFNPKTYINRAEMAVVVANTNKKLGNSSSGGTVTPPTPTANSIKGAVTEVTNGMITVLSSTGQKIGFVGNDTVPVTKEDNTAYAYSHIGVGDVVTVNYTGSTITKITVHSINPANNVTNTIEGIVDEMDGMLMYINENGGGIERFYYTNDVSVILDGSASTLKEAVTAFEDGRLSIKASLNAEGYIKKMELTSTDSDGIKGTLKDITDKEITIKRSGGGTKTYDVRSYDVTYRLDGKDSTRSKISKAMDDDTVYVNLYLNSKDEVIKVVATTDDDDDDDDYDVKGTIRSLNSSEISVKTNSGTKTYKLESPTYKLDDDRCNRSDIIDAMDDDTVYVRLYLNSNDKATDVYAYTDEPDDSTLKGEIYEITSSDITIKPKNKTKKTYRFASDIEYTLDGKSSSYSKVRNAVQDEDTVTATLTLDSKDKVTRIKAVIDDDDDDDDDDYDEKGVVQSLSRTSVKIKVSGSRSETYDFASNVTYRVDGTRGDYYDIKDEYDEAEDDDEDLTAYLTLNSRDDVTEINVTKKSGSSSASSKKGTVVDLTSTEIKIEPSSGSSKWYEFANDVKFYLDGDSTTYNKFSRTWDGESVTAKLTLNSSGYVTKVDGSTDVDTDYDEKIKGYLFGLYSDYIKVKSNSNSDAEKYYFRNKPVYRLDGKSSNYSALESAFDKKKVFVTVYLDSSDEVVKIEATTSDEDDDIYDEVSGRVSFITSNSLIKLRDYDKQYIISSSCEVKINSSNASLSEVINSLNKGEIVDATLYLDINETVVKITADID